MKKLYFYAFLLCINSLSLTYTQSPGSLDPAFNVIGKQTTDILGYYDVGHSIAVQQDGKIVMAGTSDNGVYNVFSLVRYNTDGTLDNSFSGDGILTTDVTGNNNIAYSIAIQGNGKLVVAGSAFNGSNNDFALVRYNTDGSLDHSFDNDGKLTTDVFGSNDYARSIVIQADGKIIAAGYSSVPSAGNFVLVRYNSNGSLDSTFDGDGKLSTDFSGGVDYGRSVAIQSDGKIVLGGYANVGTNYDFAVARYNVDGSLDNSFSGDGKVLTSFGNSYDDCESILIQSDGKILLAGYAGYGSTYDIALARYNTNGSLDNSFGGSGMFTFPVGNYYDHTFGIAQQLDGKILLAGFSNNDLNDDFNLVRLNIDGSFDLSFDGDGMLLTDFNNNDDDQGYCIVLQNDGKIVVGGGSYNLSGSGFDFAVARYISGLNVGLVDLDIDHSVFIYPNPVVENCRITYTLPNEELVTISLQDIQGNTLTTFLQSEKQVAGNHEQDLYMPDQIASGTYYIIISTTKVKVGIKITKGNF